MCNVFIQQKNIQLYFFYDQKSGSVLLTDIISWIIFIVLVYIIMIMHITLKVKIHKQNLLLVEEPSYLILHSQKHGAGAPPASKVEVLNIDYNLKRYLELKL